MRTPEQEQLTLTKTPFSLLSEYTPPGFSQVPDVSCKITSTAADDQADATKDKLNSPINCSTMVMPWDTVADRTK